MTAKYTEVLKKLKERILAGEYDGDKPFPSETALARQASISRSTAHRVIGELRRLGFVTGAPGENPRLTKSAASRKLGVIVPRHAYSEIFPQIVGELSRRAQAESYTLLFGDISSADPARRAADAKALAEKFVQEGVAGVMFQPIEYVSGAERLNSEVLSILGRAGIAVVLCDYDIVPPPKRSGFDVVGMNNFLAGAAMADHLASAGAQRLSFLMRPHSPLSIQNRARGAAAEVSSAGLAWSQLVAEPDDAEAIGAHMRKFRPDAFICGNDAIAANLRQTLEKLGKGVPKDVLLAGFDDVAYARFMSPPLTTMHQPCGQIADAVFDRLMARMASRSLPPQEIYLPGRIVTRESTQRPVQAKSTSGKRKGAK